MAPDSPISLLLIDDSPVVRASLQKLLAPQYQIKHAEDGAAGWEIIQQDTDIDLVITDLNMPRMGGYELLQKARTSPCAWIRDLPIIIVTGADGDEARDKALTMGATDFLTKPFDVSEMKARGLAYARYRRSAARLRAMASTDEVTGLPGEQVFLAQLERDLAYVARRQAEFAMVLLEIRQFAACYRLIGQRGAEQLLAHIAKVLRQNVRKENTVGRLNYHQFAIALPQVSGEQAQILCDRIRRAIEAFRITVAGERLELKVDVTVHARPLVHEISAADWLAETELGLIPEIMPLGAAADASADPDAGLATVDQWLSHLECDSRPPLPPALSMELALVLKQLLPLLALMEPQQRAWLLRQMQQPTQ